MNIETIKKFPGYPKISPAIIARKLKINPEKAKQVYADVLHYQAKDNWCNRCFGYSYDQYLEEINEE